MGEAVTNPSRRALILEYALRHLPYHLIQADRGQEALALLTDFDFHMLRALLDPNFAENNVQDFSQLVSAGIHPQLPLDQRNALRHWESFIRERAHLLRLGTPQWPSHKILFQLAIEHADDSPVTKAAERWLQRGGGNWFRLQVLNRPSRVQPSVFSKALAGHEGGISQVHLGPEGLLFSGSADGTIRAWDIEAEKEMAQVASRGYGGLRFFVLSDSLLLVWSFHEEVRLWDWKARRCLDGFIVRPLSIEEGPIRPLIRGAITVDSQRVAFAVNDGRIIIYDWRSRSVKTRKGWHTLAPFLFQSIGSGRCLSLSAWESLLVWNGDDDQPLVRIDAKGQLRNAIYLKDDRAVTLSESGALQLWDLRTGENLWTRSTECPATDRWSASLVRVSEDRFGLWNPKTKAPILWDAGGEPIARLFCDPRTIREIRPLSESVFAIFHRDNTITLWSSADGHRQTSLVGHEGETRGIMDFAERQVVSWALDRSVRMWDKATGKSLSALEGLPDNPSSVTSLPDGNALVCLMDGTMGVWDRRSSKLVDTQPRHVAPVGGLLIEGRRLISWSDRDQTPSDGRLLIWDLASGTCSKVIRGKHPCIHSVRCLRHGRVLVVSGESWESKCISIWDDAFQEEIAELPLRGHIAGCEELTTGNLLIWYHGDDSPDLWDVTNGLSSIFPQEGPPGLNSGVFPLPGDKALTWSTRTLTWSTRTLEQDYEARMWDVESRTCVAILAGHEGTIQGACLGVDGRIITWSRDNTIRIWDAETGRWKQTLTLDSDWAALPGCMPTILRMASKQTLMLDSDLAVDRVVAISEQLLLVTRFYATYNQLWELETGRLVGQLINHEGRLLGAHLVEPQSLLSWSDDGSFRLWDARTGHCTDHIDIAEGLRRRPEWTRLLSGRSIVGFQLKGGVAARIEHHNACLIPLNDTRSPLAQWCGMSRVTRYLLLEDNTLALGFQDGSVKFLRAYDGSRVATFPERGREKVGPGEDPWAHGT